MDGEVREFHSPRQPRSIGVGSFTYFALCRWMARSLFRFASLRFERLPLLPLLLFSFAPLLPCLSRLRNTVTATSLKSPFLTLKEWRE